MGCCFRYYTLSNGYYKMSESVLEQDPGYDPIVGEYASFHAGEGGFTNFFLGTGVNINKNFSAGVNMTFLFGQVNRINQFDFPIFIMFLIITLLRSCNLVE